MSLVTEESGAKIQQLCHGSTFDEAGMFSMMGTIGKKKILRKTQATN